MVNPYESPVALDERPGWFAWLRNFLRGFTPLTPEQRFGRGTWLIHYGVLFRIDPSDLGTVFAALPIAKIDDGHIQRNVDEALRVLPHFVQTYPSLAHLIRGRDLEVTMFTAYQEPNEELEAWVVDAEQIDWTVKEVEPP